jgi:Nif-specific regulatory protein
MDMLMDYPWSGNVRELQNGIARAVALTEEGLQIQTYHFPSQITGGESLIQEILSEQGGLSESVEHFKRRMIENALLKCAGNRTQAAQMLGTHRSSLIRLMNRLGIE